MPDVNLLAIAMNHGDQPAFVATDSESGKSVDLVPQARIRA
jgi:hypothetical protein